MCVLVQSTRRTEESCTKRRPSPHLRKLDTACCCLTISKLSSSYPVGFCDWVLQSCTNTTGSKLVKRAISSEKILLSGQTLLPRPCCPAETTTKHITSTRGFYCVCQFGRKCTRYANSSRVLSSTKNSDVFTRSLHPAILSFSDAIWGPLSTRGCNNREKRTVNAVSNGSDRDGHATQALNCAAGADVKRG